VVVAVEVEVIQIHVIVLKKVEQVVQVLFLFNIQVLNEQLVVQSVVFHVRHNIYFQVQLIFIPRILRHQNFMTT
tara:strand:+ start:62 stop:283 length:222 start_codon:yes stop_codon:yes gene_type:complete